MPKPLVLDATAAERRELGELAKSRDRQEADRARAIILSLDGVGRKRIAESLLVSVDQVSRWRGQYQRDRVDGIRARPHPGRPRNWPIQPFPSSKRSWPNRHRRAWSGRWPDSPRKCIDDVAWRSRSPGCRW